MKPSYSKALIIGAGAGLSASLARLFAREGLGVALAARSTDDLAGLARETGASLHECDAGELGQVQALFAALDAEGDSGGDSGGAPDVVVYNPSRRVRGPLVELDPEEVARAVQVSATGAFFAAQEAAKRMLPNGHGAIFLTGASAGVKGYPQSAPFAMGKFALRGLAQSMARELHPKGIHVGHVVIDGGIRSASRQVPEDRPDSLLDPDAIAESYWHLLGQDRSAWTWEIEVRPWVETF